jgi:hypothetical protein
VSNHARGGSIIVVLDELEAPYVTGFFLSAHEARTYAYRLVTGEPFSGDSSELERWQHTITGVHVTSFVAVHL